MVSVLENPFTYVRRYTENVWEEEEGNSSDDFQVIGLQGVFFFPVVLCAPSSLAMRRYQVFFVCIFVVLFCFCTWKAKAFKERGTQWKLPQPGPPPPHPKKQNKTHISAVSSSKSSHFPRVWGPGGEHPVLQGPQPGTPPWVSPLGGRVFHLSLLASGRPEGWPGLGCDLGPLLVLPDRWAPPGQPPQLPPRGSLRPPRLSGPCSSARRPLPAHRHVDVETIEAECNHCLQKKKKMVQDLFIGR